MTAAKDEKKDETPKFNPEAKDSDGNTGSGENVSNDVEAKEPAVNVAFPSDKYDVVFDGRSVRVLDTDDKSVVQFFGSRVNLRDLLSGISENQK